MSTATFYGPTDPAPDMLPPFMVVVDRGAWGCTTKEQAKELAAQLRANGRAAKILKAL